MAQELPDRCLHLLERRVGAEKREGGEVDQPVVDAVVELVARPHGAVSLRASNKQIQSLPPTPRSTDSSALVRSSTAQSVESVNSTQHLLSSSSTPVTQVNTYHIVIKPGNNPRL